MKTAIRKYGKKALCLLFSALLAAFCVLPASAAQTDVSFQYAGATYTCGFGDLEKPSNVYNKNLAICSLALISNKRNEAMFTSAGFTSYTSDSYNVPNSNDGIFYAFASKNIGDTTYVAIIIEGTVDVQWYGNIDIGYGAEHLGFSKARDTLLADLTENFLPTVNVGSKLRFLITGHSRGASTANLVAAKLNTIGSVGSVAVDKTCIYAYTFAAANTTTAADAHSAAYDNIFNIANRDDIVTVVPPVGFGYTVYGRILTLPSTTFNSEYTTLFNGMQAVYSKMAGASFTKIKTGAVIPMAMAEKMTALSGNTVDGYYNNRYTVGTATCSSYDFMRKYADTRSGNPTLANAANSFFNEAAGSSAFSPIVKLAASGGNLFSSHYPIVYTSWVASLSEEQLFSEKTFNKVTIRTDAKVKVYDKNNRLVGLVSDGAINANLADCVSILSGDNGYTVYLPGDAQYTITLVGSNAGSYTYSVAKCRDTGAVTASGSTSGNIAAGEVLQARVFETASTQPEGAYAFSAVPSTPDDEPSAPSGNEGSQSFLQRVIAFFKMLINRIKALFS